MKLDPAREPLAALRLDYPGWTIGIRYIPSASGPGINIYLADQPGAPGLAAYTIRGLRDMIAAYETDPTPAGLPAHGGHRRHLPHQPPHRPPLGA